MVTTKAGVKVFRPTITADQMIGTVEALQHYRSVHGLNKDATELLVKFERELVGIQYGTDKSAYVTKGRPEGRINLTSLGATTEEVVRYNNSPEMSDAQEAFINWQILASDEELKNSPNINEFLPGGKYYAAPERNRYNNQSHSSGSSNSGIGSSRNNGDNRISDGTDCFIDADSTDNTDDAMLADALFNQL